MKAHEFTLGEQQQRGQSVDPVDTKIRRRVRKGSAGATRFGSIVALAALTGTGFVGGGASAADALAVHPALTTAVQVVTGDSHTCALTSVGGVKCWGYNNYGQLGDGSLSYRNKPVAVSGLSSGVVAIAAGASHTCALTSSGGVKCWGANYDGQLGDASSDDEVTPVDVSGLSSGVVAIATGGSHTCALTSSGGVKCWGSGYDGQLGDGSYSTYYVPVDVDGLTSGVADIDLGANHSCALTNAGGVKCWGYGYYGQVGDGSGDDQGTPVNVSGLTSNAALVSAGDYQTCAVTSTGGAKCWGDNDYGQIGDGTSSWRYTPVFVTGLTNSVASISSGSIHSCALTNAGGVKCWGYNGNGRLGDGSSATRYAPVNVFGLSSGITEVAAGGAHTCALTTAGGVKCWGYNGDGQLGDGTYNSRYTPVNVDLGGLPTPVASVAGVSVFEGDAGSHTVDVPVTLSNSSTSTVTVGYKVFRASGDTATAGSDFVASTGTLTFSPTLGGLTPTVAFVPVTIKDDTTHEANETFTVSLTSASNASLGQSTVRNTIFNDDPGTGLRLTVSNASIVEGNSVATVGGSNAVRFHVSLSKPVAAGHSVVVTYTVTGLTATGGTAAGSGVDFLKTTAPLTLTVHAGQQDASILVRTFADTTVETNETFAVKVTSATGGAVIQSGTGTGTIVNDD